MHVHIQNPFFLSVADLFVTGRPEANVGQGMVGQSRHRNSDTISIGLSSSIHHLDSQRALIGLAILQKFHAEEPELACSLIITDTKSIWFESLLSAPDLSNRSGLMVE